jgi:hypothetical protein
MPVAADDDLVSCSARSGLLGFAALTPTYESNEKARDVPGLFVSYATAYFFFGMYRSVIVPS